MSVPSDSYREIVMLYVGLDIHTTRISVCALNQTGQVVHRAQVRGIEDMLRVLGGLGDRFEVCYEASRGCGHYHDLLRPLAARVLVARPGQLRLIFRSRNKNDRNDAGRLAEPLYLGEAPTIHVPPAEVRAWRELVNCRGQLVAKRTRAKNAPGPCCEAPAWPPDEARPVDEGGAAVAPPAGAAGGRPIISPSSYPLSTHRVFVGRSRGGPR